MNKYFLNIAIILTILTLNGCAGFLEKEQVFPEVKNINEFNQTIFLPTLESSFDIKSNGIYAASLLMAWDEIKNEISEPINEFSSPELELMNSSSSYNNVLSNDEFNSSVEVNGLNIIAKAYFKKSLPFAIPLEKDSVPLQFLEDKVMSFGFRGYNKIARVVYYINDNDFAIKLLPEDNEHEIILMKSNFGENLILKNEVERLTNFQLNFDKSKNDKNDWKYHFNEEDQVSIPIIEFNIESNYSNIEGSAFSTDTRDFLVELVYQRTAFVLNEKGAEIESRSEASASEAFIEEELPKPKRMIFDKPYLILLKRKDSDNPYFAMFVSNRELMKKNIIINK